MDPITKALHETWKKIVTEGKSVTYIDPKTGKEKHEIVGNDMIDPSDYVEPDGKGGYRPKRREEPDYDVGVEKGPDGKWNYVKKPKTKTGYSMPQGLINYLNPKPTPTPGYEPSPYINPKPKPTPGYEPSPYINPKPTPKPTPGFRIDSDLAREAAKAAARKDEIKPDYYENRFILPKPIPKSTSGYDRILPDKENPNDNIRGKYPVYQDKIPSIPIRTPAPQSTVPATTGSGLLNSVLNANKKMYNSVTGSLPSMPKIYEERDTEGQMAIGELKVLAQKAQELAGMMKDDTQLEGWVQSKITKAKDYISSVHDYMNGNPDKID